MERKAHMNGPARRMLTVIGPVRMAYNDAFALQKRLVERVLASEGRENLLVLIEHPAIITIGRSGSEAQVLADGELLREQGVAVVRTNRGGKATLHSPGQLVAYPVIDLKARGSDLHRYLRELEKWLVRLLEGYGIRADVEASRTGVWAGGGKIASIGIAVRRWVAYHGVALNVSTDLELFELIVPCGLEGVRMTSMAELFRSGKVAGSAPEFAEVAERAAALFAEEFGFAGVVRQARAEAGIA
ncbi:MAG: lipoyl(octanoyl) transferase LipB [Candidatus Brocadiia bacterium]|jgi:lipoate-protein ligase B|nr:lipoyl(octanoyl) transferase LipB [Candidatus Brocadiia bacterium]